MGGVVPDGRSAFFSQLTAADAPLSTVSVASRKHTIVESGQTADLCDPNPDRCRAWPPKVPQVPSLPFQPHGSTEAALLQVRHCWLGFQVLGLHIHIGLCRTHSCTQGKPHWGTFLRCTRCFTCKDNCSSVESFCMEWVSHSTWTQPLSVVGSWGWDRCLVLMVQL